MAESKQLFGCNTFNEIISSQLRSKSFSQTAICCSQDVRTFFARASSRLVHLLSNHQACNSSVRFWTEGSDLRHT